MRGGRVDLFFQPRSSPSSSSQWLKAHRVLVSHFFLPERGSNRSPERGCLGFSALQGHLTSRTHQHQDEGEGAEG